MTVSADDARALAGALAATLRRQRSLGASVPDDATAARLGAAVDAIVARAREDGPRSADRVGADPVTAEPEHPGAEPLASGAGSGEVDHRDARPEPAGGRVKGGGSDGSAERAARAAAPASPPKATVPRPQAPRAASGERPPWAPQKGSRPDKGVGSPALAEIRAELGDCTRCHLHGRRTHIVFGVGNPDARILFVGEAPGADEDRQAEPFVGKAGQLLTKMIGAMGLTRDGVYIANVLKCRPPGNRDPQPDEVAMCRPFLNRQIEAIAPEAIVTLGRIAPSALLGREVRITRERGKWTEYRGVPVMMTLHPAYLLRNPAAKRDAWSDLQLVMARLGLEPPSRGR